MNLAKEVKGIKTLHYTCDNWGIFDSGYKETFASLANVQYYNVMFHAQLQAGFV